METQDAYTDRILPMVRKAEGSADDAVSPRGAVGRYQIMPSTARSLGFDPAQLKDPDYNETVARAAIGDLVKQHGQDDKAVLAGYNASPAAVRKWKNNGRNDTFLPAETQNYFKRAGLDPSVASPPADTKPDEQAAMPYVPIKGSPGKVQYQTYLDAGFTKAEADKWAQDKASEYREAGFTEKEISDYFDDPPLDQSGLKELAKQQVDGVPKEFHQKVADNWVESLMGGWQTSVLGLQTTGTLPSIVNPEKAGLAQNLAFQAAQMAGDLPYMAAGFAGGFAAGAPRGAAVGGAAGAAVPVLGETGVSEAAGATIGGISTGLIGGNAAAAALPEAMRGYLIQSYQNPNGYKNASDFIQAYAGIAWDTMKAAMVGGASTFVGGKAGEAVAKAGASKLAQTAAFVAGQYPAAVATQAMLDGRVPNAQDLTASAILTVGLGIAGHTVGEAGRFVPSLATKFVEKTMGDLYVKTGVPPQDLVRIGQQNIVAQSELVSVNADGTHTTPELDKYKMNEPDLKPGTTPDEIQKEAKEGEAAPEPEKRNPLMPPEDPATKEITNEESSKIVAKQLGLPAEPEPPPEDAEETSFSEHNLTDIQKAIGGKVLTETTPGKFEFDGPVGSIIGTYLRKFGELAGFAFKLEAGETRIAEKGGASFRTDKLGRHTVNIPVTDEALTRRWYGLGRYEIIHHEIGHAIDMAQSRGADGWLTYAIGHNAALKAEALEMSKKFRPKLWEINKTHMQKDDELAADAIASYISDPTNRNGAYPTFEKFAGEGLQPYLDAAEKALPQRGPNGGWTNTESEATGFTGKDMVPGGAGGGGKGPPEEPIEGSFYEQKRIGEKMPLADAERIIDSGIGEKPGKKRPWWNPMTIYRQFVTELAKAPSLDKLVESDPMKAGIEDMLRQVYGSSGRASYFVRSGILKLGRNAGGEITYNQTKGPSMFGAIEQVKKNGGTIDGFVRYLVSARALALDARGITSGFNSVAARAVIEGTAKLYHEPLKMFVKNNEAVVDYGRDAGLWSDERAQTMKELNPVHIVFQRVVDPTFNPSTRGFGPKQPVSAIKGSTRQIVPPIPAQVNNMHYMVAAADRNIAVGHVLDAFRKFFALEPDKSPLKLTDRLDPAKLIEDYNNMPLEDRTTEDGVEIKGKDVEALVPALALKAFFARRNASDFLYFNKGKPEIWTASDPETAKLLQAAQPLGEQNFVNKVFETAAHIQRLGITTAPDFTMRTTIRSQFEAAVRSPYAGVPFHAWLLGAWRMFGAGDHFENFMKDGGFGSAVVDINENYIERDVNKLFAETGTWDHVWNVIRHPLDAYKMMHQMADNAGRMGTWELAQRKGVSGPKAAMESRKAYGDNSEKAGLPWVNSWARATMFMRPSVLDVNYFFRAMAERPGQTFAMGLGLITVPTITNYIANKMYDQDRENNISYRLEHPEYVPYSERARWQKDTMLVTPPIFGANLRVPVIPYTGGFIFHTMMERTLDYIWAKDPRAFNDWGSTFLAQFAPPVIPALALPFLEYATNTKQGTNAPLVPSALERVSPELRYTPDTSETAKNISHILGTVGVETSPIVLENYARDFFAPSVSVVKTLDGTMASNEKPWQVANLPMIGSFVARHPDMTAQPVQDFYTEFQSLEQKHADIMMAIRTKDPVLFAQVAKDPQGVASFKALKTINDTANTIHAQTAALRAMDMSKMTNAEKQKYMDTTYTHIVLAARAALRVMDSIPR